MNTLAELKRRLTIGTKLLKVEAWGKPVPEDQQLREVVANQSNAIVMKTPTQPRSWLQWPTASLLEIDDNGFAVYSAGLRDLTPDEKAVYDARPIDPEQSMQDAYTDGSVMFWREKSYFANCRYPYLWGCETKQGKKYDFNSGKVYDNKVKGQCEIRYKFI